MQVTWLPNIIAEFSFQILWGFNSLSLDRQANCAVNPTCSWTGSSLLFAVCLLGGSIRGWKFHRGLCQWNMFNWNLLKLYCSNLQWIPNHEPRETCWLPCRSFKDAKLWSFSPCQHWRYESAAIVAMYAWSQALVWSWTVRVCTCIFNIFYLDMMNL